MSEEQFKIKCKICGRPTYDPDICMCGDPQDEQRIISLTAQLQEAEKKVKEISDAAEMLWATLANVSGGDWSKQSKEWQMVCIRFRDNYFKVAYPEGSKFPEDKTIEEKKA